MIVLTKVTAETKDHHSITTKSIWTMNLTSHVIGKDSINMDDISVTSPTGFGRAAFEAQSVMALAVSTLAVLLLPALANPKRCGKDVDHRWSCIACNNSILYTNCTQNILQSNLRNTVHRL